MNARVHFTVSGVVQGVCYRSYTYDKALSLLLTGWVRNRPDGSVEVTAEGTKDALVQLVEWCHNGPPMAQVEQIVTEWEDYNDEFSSFVIRR